MDFESLNIEFKYPFSKVNEPDVSLEDDTANVIAFAKQWNAQWDDRKSLSKQFLDYYARDLNRYPVIKVCTWLDADDLHLVEEKWLGITWVALRGSDSLCVVALKNDLLQLDDGDMPSLLIWNALVNEVEGIEDRILKGVCKKPFSVVAVIEGTSETLGSHLGKRAKYRAKKTSKFLQKKMRSGSTFTFDKTIQSTISAFQHLLRREFKANEIRVFAWKVGDIRGKELLQRRENPDLEELLASINEPDNDDPEKFTLKKGAAPGDFIAPDEDCKGKKKKLQRGVTSWEVGLRRYSTEGQGCYSQMVVVDGNSVVQQDAITGNSFEVGMTFMSFDEVYDAYNRYAVGKGFGVRKGRKNYYKDRLTGGFILCSCEGKSATRVPVEERQRDRLQYRCECNARMKYKVLDGVYKVVQFNDTHTHPMIEENNRRYIQSNRIVTPVSKRIIDCLVDAGVGPSKAFRYLAEQAGGTENVGFIEQDVHNYQQSRRRDLISGGDAQALMDHLASKKAEDSNFYYNFKLDAEGRLCNVFWRDSISKVHYECYGDVMTFDTTYRTNKWNMVFAPFVGVNNHWQNIYFGCAFLHDETIPSFEWLFNCFLESMDGRQPKTIFTDQDPAMAAAIRNVLPNARHRLCGWHIEKNAVQNIHNLMSQPDFCALFNTLLWSCKSEPEFEFLWAKMLAQWKVADNSWLERLYGLKTKWSPAFSTDTFSCNIKSTQRGESANRVFSDRTCTATTLVEFIVLYEKKVGKVRDHESLLDTRTRGRPRVKVRDCGMLEHAASVYTKTMFGKFEFEFLQCMSDWLVDVLYEEGSTRYSIRKQGSAETFMVSCEAMEYNVKCSCHMFETMGLLCCHSLRVLHNYLHLQRIPEQYILKRWTKKAKQGTLFDQPTVLSCNVKSTASTRLNKLMKESFTVMSLAADNDITVEVAMKHLSEARTEIVRCQDQMFKTADECLGPPVCGSKKTAGPNVQDPVNKRKKGQKNVRIKSCLEKSKRRKGLTKNAGVSEDMCKEVTHDTYVSCTTPTADYTEQGAMYDIQGVTFAELINRMAEGGMSSGSSVARNSGVPESSRVTQNSD